MSRIALGVTGGIGAYKSVELARKLQQSGHEIFTVMTEAACRFIGPLTFEAITKNRVVTDQFESGSNTDIEHIALASNVDLLLVVPATANIIGKFANGIADDVLSSLYLATTAPVLVAPAMNSNMLSHGSVQRNMKSLVDQGVHIVEPGEGYLACGWIGQGRVAAQEEILAAVQQLLKPDGSLAGRCVLVTAGPTFEDLDPVRYLANRSTGRMGFAIAAEALARAARVLLITGPTELSAPLGAEVTPVRSADEMKEAVKARVDDADVVVMAAAVSDYAPMTGPEPQKIEKNDDVMTLVMRRTPDILAELGQRRSGGQRPILVGFAAETTNLIDRARKKLYSKQIDLLVANDVTQPGAGFSVETNVASLLTSNETIEIPRVTKRKLAGFILDRVQKLLLAPVVKA